MRGILHTVIFQCIIERLKEKDGLTSCAVLVNTVRFWLSNDLQ